MAISANGKVFRKDAKRVSKGTRNALGKILLFICFDFIVVIVSLVLMFGINNFFWDLPIAIVEQLFCSSAYIFAGLLFLALLIAFLTGCEQVYTLVLDEHTLTYRDSMKTVRLNLPCTCRKSPYLICLSDGISEITLFFDKQEGAELTEFLKGVIKN